jgi:hypothetical protein
MDGLIGQIRSEIERYVAASQRQTAQYFREEVIPALLARISMLTTCSAVSTADSGDGYLVDQVRSWRSQENGQSSTSMGRAELAGLLAVPRTNQRALTLGDPSNAVWFPLAMGNYRPTGAQPGDTALYSQSDAKQGVVWARQSGRVTAESAGGAIADLSATAKEIRLTSDVYADHIAGKDTLPTFAPGPALGGGAGVVLGSDIAMTLTMVSLGGPAGLLGTIQFGALWTTQPKLSGPMPTSQTMATPPPAGLAGAVYAVITPVQIQFFATTPVLAGIYSFTFTVTG